MKLYRSLENMLLNLIQWLWIRFITIHEYINIYKKRNLYKNVKLSDIQKKQIDEFYIENYGKKVPYLWHRLYQSYTGKFDYKYIPEIIFSTKLEPLGNKRLEVLPYENKNMLSVLFGEVDGIVIPETYLMCVNGLYMDAQRNVISGQKAMNFLEKYQSGSYQAVIKATVDTSSGRGVRVVDIVNGVDQIAKEPIENIIKSMGNNFVVQERIEANDKFRNLYPNAINTLRVVTYICENDIFVAPIAMRIGQGGGLVDNAHAGGMFIGVSDNGELNREAFTEYQNRYFQHPNTKTVFENYKLPCISEVKQVAIKLHHQVPMIRFVSWDFTIDKFERIVLIEANLHSQSVWFPQMAHGKAFFGENTAAMLKLASGKLQEGD
ncbi:MAG: sugar-transfer associated ATP-grasp domain-containing protein [Anaerostipes sp.]|jgi:hypothetical protein|nr:sugar-transfer associated ATP-grasp domain-containing protein [Anaerostipes sp.]